MPITLPFRGRAALAVTSLLTAGALLSACGSLVPVTGSTTSPTPACGTPGPVSVSDAFSEHVSLTTAKDGLQYGDIRVGCGTLVKSGSQITVEYTGWFSNGKVFDSSRMSGRQAFQFIAGEGQVIQGFDEGVLGMRVGGKRRLVLPPALGYGSQGSPPVIPPNATLVFDVEVVAAS